MGEDARERRFARQIIFALDTRQDFKNLGWSRYITGTNIRIISLSLNLLPVEKKKEERKNGNSIPMMTRCIFVSISQKGSWFLLLLSTIHSKRSFDRSSSISLSSWIFRMFKTIVRHVVVRWKLETRFVCFSSSFDSHAVPRAKGNYCAI